MTKSIIRYSSTTTSLTRGSPRVVTRRYSRVKFKNLPWKSDFHETWSTARRGLPRGVEYHDTWNTTRREVPRNVSCTRQLVQPVLMAINTSPRTTIAYNDTKKAYNDTPYCISTRAWEVLGFGPVKNIHCTHHFEASVLQTFLVFIHIFLSFNLF